MVHAAQLGGFQSVMLEQWLELLALEPSAGDLGGAPREGHLDPWSRGPSPWSTPDTYSAHSRSLRDLRTADGPSPAGTAAGSAAGPGLRAAMSPLAGLSSSTAASRPADGPWTMGAADLLALLIEYLTSALAQRERAGQPAPRAPGNLGQAPWRTAPAPTSWPSGGGSSSGGTSGGNAPTGSAAGSGATSGGTGGTSGAVPTAGGPSGLPPGQGLEGLRIQVIGDSLMVGAGGSTRGALEGAGAESVSVDAEVGRAITGSGDGKHMSPAEIRQTAEASGANVVVLELGSNHADYARFIPETMNELSKLQPPPTVVWVNTQTQRPAGAAYDASYYAQNAEINRVLAEEAARRPNLIVADWSQIAGGPGINAGDGLHLTAAGNDAMAKLILETIAGARP